MEYRAEKKAKKKAYKELKQISQQLGKEPPPNPYPSAIKEIQAEEKKYVDDRYFNPRVREILRRLKAEKDAELEERQMGQNMAGNNQQGSRQMGQNMAGNYQQGSRPTRQNMAGNYQQGGPDRGRRW